MRTIGRHWPSTAPRRDYQAACDVCGAHWRRSQLTRRADGTLACPDDASGLVALELDRLNAQYRPRLNALADAATFDHEGGAPTPWQADDCLLWVDARLSQDSKGLCRVALDQAANDVVTQTNLSRCYESLSPIRVLRSPRSTSVCGVERAATDSAVFAGAGSCSVVMRAFIPSGGSCRGFIAYATPATDYCYVTFTGGLIAMGRFSSGLLSTGGVATTVPTDDWVTVGVSYNGATVTAYLDGVAVGTDALAKTISATLTSYSVGGNFSGSGKHDMGICSAWSGALTAARHAANHSYMAEYFA